MADTAKQQEQQQFCLKWNNFCQHLRHAFSSTWSSDELFTDVVLATAYGERVRAHRMVLSACSGFFNQLLLDVSSEVEPVLILHDVSASELHALVYFMYHGEVNVVHDAIPALLRAAENLQIRGLCTSPPTAQSVVVGSAAADCRTDTVAPPITHIPVKKSRGTADSGRHSNKRNHDTPPGGTHQKRQRVVQPSEPGQQATHSQPVLTEVTPQLSQSAVATEDGSDGETGESKLKIDERNNGLEPVTLLDEQDACSLDSSDSTREEQFFPLPRSANPAPNCYSALQTLSSLAVKVKLVPKECNDLETAIVAAMPRSVDYGVRDGCFVASADGVDDDVDGDQDATLAFHEPRSCCQCGKMYRDASTLRTHTAIMHTEGLDPFVCSCGSLFRTKYAMYLHKRQGHPSLTAVTA